MRSSAQFLGHTMQTWITPRVIWHQAHNLYLRWTSSQQWQVVNLELEGSYKINHQDQLAHAFCFILDMCKNNSSFSCGKQFQWGLLQFWCKLAYRFTFNGDIEESKQALRGEGGHSRMKTNIINWTQVRQWKARVLLQWWCLDRFYENWYW